MRKFSYYSIRAKVDFALYAYKEEEVHVKIYD